MINDGNVLPFRIDYIKTIKDSDKAKDKQVSAIDTEKALLNQARISEIVSYILGHFDQKTKRNRGDSFTFSILENVEEVATAKNRNEIKEKKNKIRIKGFNSIFAVSSIAAAKLYYTEFKHQMENLPEAKRLRIARYSVMASMRRRMMILWLMKIPRIQTDWIKVHGISWKVLLTIIIGCFPLLTIPQATSSKTIIKMYRLE